MKSIQIIPKGLFNLYGAMRKKELQLRRKGKGLFRRVGTGKWHHKNYWGWVRFEESLGNILNVEVSTKTDQVWQLLTAFIGFVERHFGDRILAVNIQYR